MVVVDRTIPATRIGAPHKSLLHGNGHDGLLHVRRSRRIFLDVSSLNLAASRGAAFFFCGRGVNVRLPSCPLVDPRQTRP